MRLLVYNSRLSEDFEVCGRGLGRYTLGLGSRKYILICVILNDIVIGFIL